MAETFKHLAQGQLVHTGNATAQELYDNYEPDVIIIEKKASGQSLIQDLRRAGLPILEYNPDRDKVTRTNASTPILEAGRVWVPDKPFAQDLINEAAAFPYATYDDQVDAMVMAILYMKDAWKVDHPLDAFQINCYRRILGIPPTYIDKTWTNKKVIEKLDK